MSEEKVAQHTENAIHILKNKKLGWKGKLKEILQETLIIVFAVSITLAFHNWNDHRKEKEIEKDFLKGIKNDLVSEKENLDESNKDFQPTIDFYDTAWTRILQNRITPAYLDTNAGYLLNTSYFVFDKGRFEGFKSSGYLRLIENQQLQKDLITLYTSDMPFEEDIDKNLFQTRSNDFITYIGSKAPADANGIHVSKIIGDPAVRYQVSRYAGYFNERKRHKQQLVKRIDKVVEEIETDLKNF